MPARDSPMSGMGGGGENFLRVLRETKFLTKEETRANFGSTIDCPLSLLLPRLDSKTVDP